METGSGKRKLTAILAADVDGYSRLMSEDEEATLATLKDYRSVIFNLIDRHDGRVFNTGGDSVLAEFASAVEAVRCAVSVQEDLRIRNANLDDMKQLRFRIGLNLGDVMVEGDDLFGDGVNVAARLESIAPSGGICISGTVFEQVKNKVSLGFEDIGAQQVKNISDPIHAYKLVPGPVSVLNSGSSGPVAAIPKYRGVRVALLIAGVAATLGAGALFGLLDRTNEAEDSMGRLLNGMTINGVAKLNGNRFKILLQRGGGAEAHVQPPPDKPGRGFSETGKWWVEDNNFCMQFEKFAQGRLLCPRLEQDGETIKAYRHSDGSALPWTFKK